eukprot:TRINITY_DN1366_c0_g2_i1.p1 TRINITY_DN1366_c0_g2~~TRINITY_DN1366_c0_g2_i1.p1  ORF type:complete len:905 (+),score=227.46 TRINITY_DN1366_c0_g2_i1:35-2716(+)
MSFDFELKNVCGTVYKQGTVCFTPNGNCVLSPVGNRVSVFDLVKDESYTFPFETQVNLRVLAISPDSTLILLVDEDGGALLAHFQLRFVISYLRFSDTVRAAKFSPNGKHIAVACGRNVQVWKVPPPRIQFAPFLLHRTFSAFGDNVTSVDWSSCGEYIVAGSRDMSVRVFTLAMRKDFVVPLLSGHKSGVVGVSFGKTIDCIWSVSEDGTLIEWHRDEVESEENEENSDDDGGDDDDDKNKQESDVEMEIDGGKETLKARKSHQLASSITYFLAKKNFFHQSAKTTSCAFHSKRGLVVVGFSHGVFALFDVESFSTALHTLKISDAGVQSVALNQSGEWIAFGCSRMGQLLVWEWQSESYVLRQQGHALQMTCTAYSPDGQYIATGGRDGKVKVWNTKTGFCFVTFAAHEAPVTGVVFSSKNAIFSSSEDGTCKAFDTVRYKNFRTYTAPRHVMFSSITLDPSGEILCSGSGDSFEIYVWEVQTAKIIDVLSGHEGPIASLAFNPKTSLLASASWDRTVRLWDLFSKDMSSDPLLHAAEVLDVSYSGDGTRLVTACMDGQLRIWDPLESRLIHTIEGKMDVRGGRTYSQAQTAKNFSGSFGFTCTKFSADGQSILAGGNSRFLCVYHHEGDHVMLRKYEVSKNRSLAATVDKLNTKKMTDFGVVDDYLLKQKRIQTLAMSVSPTGRSFAVSTTEGLLIYELDSGMRFAPVNLDLDITPANILSMAEVEKNFVKAVVMAFRLNEDEITCKVFDAIPPSEVEFVCTRLPPESIVPLLNFLASKIDKDLRLELVLKWCSHVMTVHGRWLRDDSSSRTTVVIRDLIRGITRLRKDLAAVCDGNKYALRFLVMESKSKSMSKESHSDTSKTTGSFSEERSTKMDKEERHSSKRAKKD